MANPAQADGGTRGGTRSAEADPMPAVLSLAWRPAWSMRRRVGCLAPIIASVRARLGRAPKAAGETERPR